MPVSFKVQHPAGVVNVRKRPLVDEFLRAVAEDFELVIFTAGTKEYANLVLDVLDKDRLIQHRLFRDHCSGPDKELSRLGRDLATTLLLDNRGPEVSPQAENVYAIPDFDGLQSESGDRELEKVQHSLKRDIVPAADVRVPLKKIETLRLEKLAKTDTK